MKIGIMGGTYNPPHIGHLHAAISAREHVGLDKVILVPSNIPPHKELPECTPSAQARLAMTRIAAQNIGAEVCAIELERDGVSYTADTAEAFSKAYPNDQLYFIVGTDMFLTMQDWHQPERIFAVAKIIAIARNRDDEEKICNHKSVLEKLGAEVLFVSCEALPISSTELRDGIKDKQMRRFLPDGVWDYIAKEHLYEV